MVKRLTENKLQVPLIWKLCGKDKAEPPDFQNLHTLLSVHLPPFDKY